MINLLTYSLSCYFCIITINDVDNCSTKVVRKCDKSRIGIAYYTSITLIIPAARRYEGT